MNLVAQVGERHWSGHGEGGTVLEIRISGFTLSNLYDNASNPADRKIADDACAYLNRALEFYKQAQAKPA